MRIGAIALLASAGIAGALTPVQAQTPPATYQDLDGIVTRMHAIAAANPAIAQVVDVTAAYGAPPTFEGRHLYALRISDNVEIDEDEPAMLIVGTHHAREVVPPVIALHAAEQLTSGYGVDARVTAAVDSHEIWIAPVWNPDGYNHVFTLNGMWRKNRRVVAGGIGVDQNRNYAQGWSASCSGSTSPTSETYKGPSAASEPETRTMMRWSETERFAKVIDYHSYGREVLYGYRCLNHPFQAWMQQEAAAISTASGYGGHTRVPSADGEHQQWQFAQMGAYAFLIETHSEFQPAYDSAVREAEVVWPGIFAVLERAIPLSGHVTDAATGAALSARVELLNVRFTQGETNSSGGAFGAYHAFVPPGTYDVRFSAHGYRPETHRVTIGGATSATVLDVALGRETLVFSDDFETSLGWTRNMDGRDTATTGLWERGDPQGTSSNGVKQLDATTSGVSNLVTGRLAGSSAGSHDVDGGRTSIQSPEIDLPADGTLTLRFRYYFAHSSNSSSADYLRVMVVSDTRTLVLEELGAPDNDDASWASVSADLSGLAGKRVSILIEAADASGSSLVEAAIDDVAIVRH